MRLLLIFLAISPLTSCVVFDLYKLNEQTKPRKAAEYPTQPPKTQR